MKYRFKHLIKLLKILIKCKERIIMLSRDSKKSLQQKWISKKNINNMLIIKCLFMNLGMSYVYDQSTWIFFCMGC